VKSQNNGGSMANGNAADDDLQPVCRDQAWTLTAIRTRLFGPDLATTGLTLHG
jgi:hypothetical protein